MVHKKWWFWVLMALATIKGKIVSIGEVLGYTIEIAEVS